MKMTSSYILGAMVLTLAAGLLIPHAAFAQTSTDTGTQKLLSAMKSRAAQAAGTSGGGLAVLLICPPTITSIGQCSFTALGTLQNMTQ